MSKGQYVCQRAAHAIIAEIGPLRVSSDALVAMNVFIDEFLALLITLSSSLDLVQLKTSVLRLLPLSLGKNALVEAEIELKHQVESEQYDFTSYEKMRNLASQDGIFPVNQVIPLLQVACANYCALSATATVTTVVTPTVVATTNIIIPPVVVIYITTIVEHVAEYILNLVAMTADQADTEHIRVKEVLIALLDDPQVFMLFRRMNLKEKLEKKSLIYPVLLKRNQSTIIKDDMMNIPPLPTPSIKSSSSINDRPISIMSNESVKSNNSNKSRFNFFNKDNNNNNNNKEKRNSSISLNFSSSFSSTKRLSTTISPTTTSNDFDDLIKSGNTKKVSLTPNRLKSIEIKQESNAIPWERFSIKKTETPPPLPPLSHIHQQLLQQEHTSQVQQRSSEQLTSKVQQLTLEQRSSQVQHHYHHHHHHQSTNDSPPLTPASSVSSRPSQRSRHSIIYQEKDEPTTLNKTRPIIERPSSMVVKRASMGSRPPSFHENLLIDCNLMAAKMDIEKPGMIYVLPKSPFTIKSTTKSRTVDRACQTDPIELHLSIQHHHHHHHHHHYNNNNNNNNNNQQQQHDHYKNNNQEEEWFIEEEEWENSSHLSL